MTTEIARRDDAAQPAAVELALVRGDLSRLGEEQRLAYYRSVCETLGLNPLTRPFEYLTLNGRLTLYVTRAGTDQLRALRGITITSLEPRRVDDLYVVVVHGRDREGREDVATGAVSIAGLRGDALANAMMRAETKAKRRLTLSLAGLGWTDESELDTIPQRQLEPRPSLAERASARAAEVIDAIEPPQVELQTPELDEPPPAHADAGPTEATAEAPAEVEALDQTELYRRLGQSGANRQLVVETLAELGLPPRLGQLTDEERGRLWRAIAARLAPA